MVKAFCSVCGSSLFGGIWPDGPSVSIRLGTLDGDPGISPQFHSYVESKAAWDELPDDGLPRFAQAPAQSSGSTAARVLPIIETELVREFRRVRLRVHGDGAIADGDHRYIAVRHRGRGRTSGAAVEMNGYDDPVFDGGLIIQFGLYGQREPALRAAGLA